MKAPPTTEAEWEVLPPESKTRSTQAEPLFRWLALIMDELLHVPGTKFRFGLDPLIGLIPGIGDTGSALVSALALVQAARQGIPKILLARMALNILVNQIVGLIPVVGDAFSFWFKANARNHEILKGHSGAPRAPRRSDWIFVIGALVLIFLVVVIGIAVSLFLLTEATRILAGF